MNTKRRFYAVYSIILTLAVSSLLLNGCNRANKTLAELGDEKVTLGEFEKQYLKTLSSPDSAKLKSFEDRKQFLDLYINFRLKVKDGRERGLMLSEEIKKDVDEYVKNLYPSFLIDKEVVEPHIEKLYDKKKEEVRASHILINLAEKPTPQDSVAAYQKADSIIQMLKDGGDFNELAVKYSSDRTVLQNKGDLYYFTGGMTVDEFEDIVFALSVGEYTKKPVRTMFGLHIVKLTDKKPRIESIRASHILIQDKRDSVGKMTDSLITYQKALDIFNRIKNGEDWNTLCQQFTEDPGSKPNNGDLGYFERRRMTQSFDSAVFVAKTGDIIGPIRTQYGWHIIKKVDEKPLSSFEKQKEQLKQEYKRTNKYKQDYAAFIEKLKGKYNFKSADDGFNYLRSKLDSSKSIADYNVDSLIPSTDRNKVIAQFDGGTITVQDMLNHLNINKDFQRTAFTNEGLNNIISSASEQNILRLAAEKSKIKDDKDFISTVKDYENGLLVFRIDQDELWSKVRVLDEDMQSFYKANMNKYTTKDSAGTDVPKSFEDAKAQLSNDVQQLKFKEIEKKYLDGLREKYPVKIYDEVLRDAFKD